MNKIFSALTMVAVLTVGSTAAQHSKFSRIYITNENMTAFAKTVHQEPAQNDTLIAAPAVSMAPAEINTISRRAIRNFNETFSTASEIKWFRTADGITAYCTVDGIRNRVCYDKKGNLLFSTQYYGEKKLPKEVRVAVKEIYYDFIITGVLEVRNGEKVYYVVYMQDDSTFTNIRVFEGNITVLETYQNANR